MKKLEPIVWKTFRPDSFPCIVCGEDEAVYIRHENGFYLPVCLKCAERPWDEIMETMKLEREEEVNMKYTPGPWEVISYSVFQADEVGNKQVVHNLKGQTHEERLANAHLIAAAPELLEACKGLLGILTPKQYSKQFPNLYRKAKAAIAKAEGKEP